MKYTFAVGEFVTYSVDVEADTEDDAIEIARSLVYGHDYNVPEFAHGFMVSETNIEDV